MPLAPQLVTRGPANRSLNLLSILPEVILQINQETTEVVGVEVEAAEMMENLLIKPNLPRRKLLPVHLNKVLPALAVLVNHQVTEEVMMEKELVILIFPKMILTFHGGRTWPSLIAGFFV